MLVRAFDDDPVANFLFDGPGRRTRGLRSFFTTQVARQYLPGGQVHTADDHSGAAVWAPADRVRHPVLEIVQLLPTAPYLVSPRFHRALQLVFLVDSLHPKEPHWYLATLGTEPDRQGQGVGSALMEHVLARVDGEAMPAYLESSKERNVPFYARFGFEVIDEVHGPGGAPTMWRMWREPRQPDS